MIIFLVHIFSLLTLGVSRTSTTQAILVGLNTSQSDSSQSEERRDTHEVQFHYRIAANRMGHLTCEVATEICYVDCTPACVFDEVEGCVVPTTLSSVIEGCRFEQRRDSGSLLLEYTVDMEALDRTGDWNCEYQGVSAPRALKLQASPRLPITTTIPTTAFKISMTTSATINAIAPVVTMKARFPPSAVKDARPKSALQFNTLSSLPLAEAITIPTCLERLQTCAPARVQQLISNPHFKFATHPFKETISFKTIVQNFHHLASRVINLQSPVRVLAHTSR
ncbi:unnamed protein product [Hydatigera taeniaeformis]|uniref:Phlebovirus_G2 domain-containing protein n=1 Tax=Hydatigena taeniaeformis TaxID=6205 RepID=A0A0R3WJ85_HYDTA|nr:unnamed protein product [Hydatigera taeniaeformis]